MTSAAHTALALGSHLPPGPRTLRCLPDGWEPAEFKRLRLTPCAATIGALVEGVDLSVHVDDELFAELDRALLEWKVLFFRDQMLSPVEHASFAARCALILVPIKYLPWETLFWVMVKWKN